MKRPKLNKIELTTNYPGLMDTLLKPGNMIVTMSVDQWDILLQTAYDEGAILLELDDDEKPVAAYQRSDPLKVNTQKGGE